MIFLYIKIPENYYLLLHLSLRDSKSPQISWTLLSILADLSYAVVWMVSTNHIYQPLRSGRIWHKWSLTGFNSEFSFSLSSCLTKAEEPCLPYYLLIAGGRIIGFIPFARVLVLCEMQSVSFRIWTRVAVSISYDNNHYTTGTSTRPSISKSSSPFINP